MKERHHSTTLDSDTGSQSNFNDGGPTFGGWPKWKWVAYGSTYFN